MLLGKVKQVLECQHQMADVWILESRSCRIILNQSRERKTARKDLARGQRRMDLDAVPSDHE